MFYRCNPGLVPEGTMRAVCTRNGWSPNPMDLRCAGLFHTWEGSEEAIGYTYLPTQIQCVLYRRNLFRAPLDLSVAIRS